MRPEKEDTICIDTVDGYGQAAEWDRYLGRCLQARPKEGDGHEVLKSES